jgi:addiction module RelB/DinJ family antitoxin
LEQKEEIMSDTYNIEVTNDLVKKAEQVLLSLGMDVTMAVNIFLRRIVSENGFPLSMAVPVINRDFSSRISDSNIDAYENISTTKTNKTITMDMVEEVWTAFKVYLNEGGNFNDISAVISERTGMNSGSAFIYLNILNTLVSGEMNTRNMKIKDLEYYLKLIQSELDKTSFDNAIVSLIKSIPYWEIHIPGQFSENVRILVEKYN